MQSAEFCIIGGGIIGLMTARELLSAGASVTVVEAAGCGQQASWAAGGIVSPLYPWRYPAPVTALADQAQSIYPKLSEQLRAATGIDPEWQRSGLLLLDLEDQTEALSWAAERERAVSIYSTDTLATCQDGLSADISQAICFPDVAQVRNPRLLKALLADVKQRGGQMVEQCSVTGLQRDAAGNRITAVQTANGTITAGQFVICAGAWSAQLLAPFGIDLPVTPVRGQMLMFAPHAHSLQRIVLRDGRYLIPRRDGRIICGSTMEHAGFDQEITADARQSLWQSAIAIMPSLRQVDVEQQWAGLRPGSPNGIPFIGRLPSLANAWINAGHYRNGIVLAPASARLLTDLMQEKATSISAAPYALGISH
ncbi:glycine oxidase ThiO [Permianibacter sp. IMCC34836]|uniref:glycine oxidase ThiO n=1 Tax=Permianibacter fluminis TaxID=2738515 RepID=UPI0015566B2D|nr:glycine oxidase ThiO [Permianibacter fluminis]NQD38919.1 glycine oxidase ThiO [Permianibacter fluminis]